MKKHFSFQTRLVITYTVFTAILALIFTLVFYFYILNNYSKNLVDNMIQITQKTAQQLDASIFDMDSASRAIYSDWDNIIKPLNDFYFGKNDDPQLYDLYRNFSNIIGVMKFAHKKIDRITIFNTNGYFATSAQEKYLSEEDLKRIFPNTTMRETISARTSFLLLPPQKDQWENNSKTVISAWQAIKNSNVVIGYIEIQKNYEEIKQICNLGENSRIKMLVVDSMDNVIYPLPSDSEKTDISLYLKNTDGKNDIVYITNPATDKKEAVSYSYSDYTGWKIFAIEDYKDFTMPLSLAVKTIIFINLGIVAFTVLVFNLLSRNLTRPLKLLKNKMETITMTTLPNPIETEHENDEINALNKSFVNMKDRLEKALSQEVQSRSLHLNAHFNALQAQINPHFLFNMLGVVAGLGDEAEKPEISEICSKMSKMLRYSSSTRQKLATIDEEVVHTETYLSLMKKRFEERLEYCIDVDAAIKSIKIPKLILQPLVENSIYHGFENFAGIMKISITGRVTLNEWYLEISDNGSGFEQNSLAELIEKIEEYSKNLMENQPSQEMSIGGMGLLNTFARLYLVYDKELNFQLRNNENQGASIRIGSPLQ